MALRAKDIAEMLGVSTATVSLVLNNKPGVGEKRRQEIIQKIKEMDCGYMLKEQRINNGSIGFVVYKREGSIVDESPFSHISWRESITASTTTDIPLTSSTSTKPCPGRSRSTR